MQMIQVGTIARVGWFSAVSNSAGSVLDAVFMKCGAFGGCRKDAKPRPSRLGTSLSAMTYLGVGGGLWGSVGRKCQSRHADGSVCRVLGWLVKLWELGNVLTGP
jgi:hypothetical protein